MEEGSYVKTGQVIARLENTDYMASINKAKADIEYAKANLAEMQRQAHLQEGLFKEKVVSQDALDSANSKVRLAKATLAQDEASLRMQETQLEFTEIRAPFDGVVVKKMAEVGESVAPIPPGVNISTSSGAIVAIADMNSLEAEVDVNEANVGQLTQGEPADISVQAIPNQTYKGVLRQVIPTADRTKATVTVKVSILDKDRLIKPEMSCNVTFLEPAKKGDQKEVVADAHRDSPQGRHHHSQRQAGGLCDRKQQGARSDRGDGQRTEGPGDCEVGNRGNGNAGEQSSAERLRTGHR